VPANVRGTWQGGGWRLVISQNYQDLGVEASRDGRAIPEASATLSGRALSVCAPGFSLEGRLEGERIAGELEREGRRLPLVLQKAP
jgi:hypothetical protein